eukprot:TRINITY_DN6059_c0_g1_i1.p1 TRINITY_DN6059_c0_g1~~TRINITY_DN6059_c0_g1_i1.p1  ORF type:complete len:121 (-),score=12.26 TRINITY_DN6059_c0_g1_i1:57-419(-)
MCIRDRYKVHASGAQKEEEKQITSLVTKVTKINEKTIAVTDRIGTIRLFSYPCDSNTKANYFGCYAEHLSNITQCYVSPQRDVMITSSEVDRCIFVWNIISHDPNHAPKDGDREDDESPT